MNNPNHAPSEQRRFLTSGSGIVWTNADANSSAPPSKQPDFLRSGSGIVWENSGSTTSASPPEQQGFLTSGSRVAWTNVNTSKPAPRMPVVWTNVDTSTSAPRPEQQGVLTSGSRIVWTDADSQNEGPSYGGDPSTLAKEVELAPEDAEPCAKEVENMKARIATYKDFICDLVHKESQHAKEAGWTPAILNILEKTAEELVKLSAEA